MKGKEIHDDTATNLISENEIMNKTQIKFSSRIMKFRLPSPTEKSLVVEIQESK